MSTMRLKTFVNVGHWIWISAMVSMFSAGTAVAQPMMGEEIIARPLKLVIMLGPEFDFKEPPFTDASELRDLFAIGSHQFSPPTLESITVDVTTKLPEGNQPIVVATYPSETSEEELQKLKRLVQLNAVRFSINQVEMVPHDEKDPSSIVNCIWLRVPRNHNWDQQSPFRYSEIAVALASDMTSPFHADQPRIDIFEGSELPSSRVRDPFAVSPAAEAGMVDPFGQDLIADPFGGSGSAANPSMDDPFGGNAAADDPFGPGPTNEDKSSDPTNDPFGTRSPTIDPVFADPFSAETLPSNPYGTSDVVQTVEQLATEIALIKEIREKFRVALETTVREQATSKAIELAKPLIDKDLQAQVRLQQLEILMLEQKLAKLKSEFQVRARPEALREIQQQRLNKLFDANR